MKVRPRLTIDKVDEFVELFSEHIKFPTSIVFSEKMDEAKIDQKQLKGNGLLLEQVRRLQGNLTISSVVVKSTVKETAERKHSSWKSVDGDAQDFAVVVGKRARTTLRLCASVAEEADTKMGAKDPRRYQTKICRSLLMQDIG